MGLGCGTTFVKYVLFVFNFLIAVGGIALITIGSIVFARATDLKTDALHDVNPTSAAIALIAFGGIIFLISFFGCCGAIRESYCLMMTYASILLVIFIAQVVVAVLVLVYREDVKGQILNAIGKVWANPNQPGNQDVINSVQQTFQCCGWGGPLSSITGLVNTVTCAADGHLDVDCKTRFIEFFDTNAALLAWVAMGVAAIELVALIFACCLGNNVRNAQRRYA